MSSMNLMKVENHLYFDTICFSWENHPNLKGSHRSVFVFFVKFYFVRVLQAYKEASFKICAPTIR